jgi:hypothetical protein
MGGRGTNQGAVKPTSQAHFSRNSIADCGSLPGSAWFK